MAINRFAQMFAPPSAPSASNAVGLPAGFAVCPIFIVQIQSSQQLSAIQELYRRAYEQALANTRRTWYEKRFFSVWN